MKITFAEIKDQGLRLEINDESWFPDQELDRTAPVCTQVFLERKGAERVLMEGEVKTALTLTCDRCLEPYTMDIDASFKVDIELNPDQEKIPEEHQCSDSEMDTFFVSKPVIDLFEILAQQIFLLLPQKHVCKEKCRGLCPQCGINLNEDSCRCKETNSTSPFGILASLKK